MDILPGLSAFRELADIQYRLAQIMQAQASIEKEYLMCFAEAEHFQHVHIHCYVHHAMMVVAIPKKK